MGNFKGNAGYLGKTYRGKHFGKTRQLGGKTIKVFRKGNNGQWPVACGGSGRGSRYFPPLVLDGGFKVLKQ